MRLRPLLFLASLSAAAGTALAAAAVTAGLRGPLDAGQTLLAALDPGLAPPAATGRTITAAIAEAPSGNPRMPPANPRMAAQGRIDTSDQASGFVTGQALRRRVAEDPYAPLGTRIGGLIYDPAVTFSAGYSSNAEGKAGGRGAGLAIVSPELVIRSDWARHAATLALRGSYEKFSDGSIADIPTAAAEATARVDLAGRWNIAFAAGYDYSRQAISDPNFPAGATRPPDVHAFHASSALNGDFGPGIFTLEGKADYTFYADANSGGVVIDQSDRNNASFGGRLRLGYEVLPGLTPFVEGELTERLYDQRVDDSGIARSSHGAAVRAGVAFDDAPVLKGEIALGARQEVFDDKALATLSALTIDGSLVWSPTALTAITTSIATLINPSTSPTSSGSIIYDASVDLAYAYRRNLTLDWTAGVRNEQFQGAGRDWTYRLGAAATWRINRNLQLTSGYVHEWLDNSTAGRDYASDTLRVDLRLQR
jgi:hypothetical protein